MAADSRSFAEPAAEALPRAFNWPGLRTLRSPRFRLLLAAALWLIGSAVLGMVLQRQIANPAGQYAFDFQAYHAAAADMAAGRSPYDAIMFAGPVPAQGAVLYKYPPLLAQLLIPLAALPLAAAAATWFVGQAAAILVGVWLAARAGGAPRSLETLCWCGVAATFFLPNYDTLWKGNVSGFLALTVAVALLGGDAGGLGSAAAALLKTTPVLMLPSALVAGWRHWLGLAAAAAVAAAAAALAPAAWSDFVRVLPNLVAGPSHFTTNLAPDSLLSFALPEAPLAAAAMRWLAIGVGVVAVAASVIVARRAGGWPAAVVLATAATLLLPSATWYHYLAVLLPPAAFAWPRASRRARIWMVVGAACVVVGVGYLPIAVAGAAIVATATLAALWPVRSAANTPVAA